jgi:hypothetical protein
MEIIVKLSNNDMEFIKTNSRRGEAGEDVFTALRRSFCSDHDECECDRWENCRDCVLGNIDFMIEEVKNEHR